MQGLVNSRETLESALRSYVDACRTMIHSPKPSIPAITQNLPNLMEAELELYVKFCSEVAQGRALLSKARNSLTSLVPINSLPDEVLLRIFYFVMKANSLEFETIVDRDMLPAHALAPSQVCNRWRQIALSSRNLWSNIDVSVRNEALSLGEVFAHRSRDIPLNIHVIEPLKGCDQRHFVTLVRFIGSVGPRVTSFELNMLPDSIEDILCTYAEALRDLLLQAKPVRFTRFSLSSRSAYVNDEGDFDSYCHWFLFPQQATTQFVNRYGKGLMLGMNPQHYEDVFAHIKVLELDMIYPLWSSRAYHGLVELRLVGPRSLLPVLTSQQLATILSSSPGLRVFYFGLEVSLIHASPDPVRLENLEVFSLHSLNHYTQQTVLKLVEPGSKALQMSMTFNERELGCLPAQFDEEFRRFFRRSNLTELEVYGSELKVKFAELLQLLPNIQTLAFRLVDLEEMHAPNQAHQEAPSCSRLHNLHLSFCTFTLNTLRRIVSAHSLQRVTLYACSILPDTGIPYHAAKEYEAALMAISPVIQILEQEYVVGIGDWGPGPKSLHDKIANAGLTDYALLA